LALSKAIVNNVDRQEQPGAAPKEKKKKQRARKGNRREHSVLVQGVRTAGKGPPIPSLVDDEKRSERGGGGGKGIIVKNGWWRGNLENNRKRECRENERFLRKWASAEE
jgi:hypothetical protein